MNNPTPITWKTTITLKYLIKERLRCPISHLDLPTKLWRSQPAAREPIWEITVKQAISNKCQNKCLKFASLLHMEFNFSEIWPVMLQPQPMAKRCAFGWPHWAVIGVVFLGPLSNQTKPNPLPLYHVVEWSTLRCRVAASFPLSGGNGNCYTYSICPLKLSQLSDAAWLASECNTNILQTSKMICLCAAVLLVNIVTSVPAELSKNGSRLQMFR